MPKFRLKFERPYALQAEIIDHPARYRVVATGRRTGKTTLATIAVAEFALKRAGSRIWWVAPTNSITDVAYRRLKDMLSPVTVKAHETRKWIILNNGSQIWFKSAEVEDKLRGEGLDFLVMDESAFIRNLHYVWDAILRPMLIDREGRLLAISTPNKRNHFYNWFVWGLDPEYEDWQSWNFPTTDNPFLPKRELEQLLQEYDEGSTLYKQEILGEFVAGEGAVFSKVRDACILAPIAEPSAGMRIIGGLDWGKKIDHTVLSLFDADTMEQAALIRLPLGLNSPEILSRLNEVIEVWNPEVIIAESNAGGDDMIDYVVEQYRNWNINRFLTTASSKRPLIEGLKMAIETGQVGLLDDPILISELESYEVRYNPNTGYASYSAPQGAHDDTVMATALAWHGLQGAGLSFGVAEV